MHDFTIIFSLKLLLKKKLNLFNTFYIALILKIDANRSIHVRFSLLKSLLVNFHCVKNKIMSMKYIFFIVLFIFIIVTSKINCFVEGSNFYFFSLLKTLVTERLSFGRGLIMTEMNEAKSIVKKCI